MSNNFYKIKYYKYKNKYLKEKDNNIRHSTNFLNPNKLCLGTDAYEHSEEHKNILRRAIDVGYRLFDTAEMYKNKDLIAEVINEKIQQHVITRKDVYINHKIRPIKDLSDDSTQIFYKYMNEAISLFGYIDCFMFHNDKFLNETMEPMINFITELMNRGLIHSIGLSNPNILKYINKKIPCGKELANYNINVSSYEIKFNIINDHIEYYKYTQSCIQNNVNVLIYGALGGKIGVGSCGATTINPNIPVVEFNNYSYPNINKIFE